MKTIVAHLSPDLDAITSCWLVKRFMPGWKNAQIKFVPAGTTLDNKSPDENPEIIHVDTGGGRFDHHQTNDHTSATKLVFEFLLNNKLIRSRDEKALQRIIDFVTDIDHFSEVYFPDADSDRYDFILRQIIDGLKSVLKDDLKLTEYVFPLLDAVLIVFKNKISAEKDLEKGLTFHSYLGKSLAIESKNEETVKLALKKGFAAVIRRNPDKGSVRIKTLPDKKLSLKPVYDEIIKIDKKGSWYLHISNHMLLNSSSGNPNLTPTSLTLNKIIEIVKGI